MIKSIWSWLNSPLTWTPMQSIIACGVAIIIAYMYHMFTRRSLTPIPKQPPITGIYVVPYIPSSIGHISSNNKLNPLIQNGAAFITYSTYITTIKNWDKIKTITLTVWNLQTDMWTTDTVGLGGVMPPVVEYWSKTYLDYMEGASFIEPIITTSRPGLLTCEMNDIIRKAVNYLEDVIIDPHSGKSDTFPHKINFDKFVNPVYLDIKQKENESM